MIALYTWVIIPFRTTNLTKNSCSRRNKGCVKNTPKNYHVCYGTERRAGFCHDYCNMQHIRRHGRRSKQPYPHCLYSNLLQCSYVATEIMTSVILVNIVSSVITGIATASRMLWSFARDQGLPFSAFFSHVSEHFSLYNTSNLLKTPFSGIRLLLDGTSL